jgi:oligosaccharide repeat unit polymerase
MAAGISIFSGDISLSPAGWSLIFCAFAAFLTVSRTLTGISPTSLYALQFYAICLFIGGRFAAFLLSQDQNPFEMTFFVTYSLDDSGANRLVSLVIGAISAMEFGACIVSVRKTWSGDVERSTVRVTPPALKSMLLLVVPLVLVSLYQSYTLVRDYGYLGLYLGQTTDQSSVVKSIATTMAFALMGLAVAYGDRTARRAYFIVYFFMAVINLLYGARGGFVTFILFAIWIGTDLGAKKIGFGKIFACFAGIGVFVIYFMNAVSARGDGSVEGSIFENIAGLLYDQGVTLMVFDLSTKTHDYPWVPYVQNFLPGVSFLVNIFSTLRPQDAGFSKYLSYVNNSDAYDDGYGLGWSLFGDLYVYAKGNWVVFVLLAVLIGYGIAKAEAMARHKPLIKALLVSAAPSIMFLPRAGLNSVFPLVIYTVVLALLLSGVVKFLAFVTSPQARLPLSGSCE